MQITPKLKVSFVYPYCRILSLFREVSNGIMHAQVFNFFEGPELCLPCLYRQFANSVDMGWKPKIEQFDMI